MALFIVTPDPYGLLTEIKEAIDKGHIDTWMYDKDGDFTHTPPQWKDRAWLRPMPTTGALMLGIVGQKNTTMLKEVYAVYHGRFIEMLLAHVDQRFSSAQATALLQAPDLVK